MDDKRLGPGGPAMTPAERQIEFARADVEAMTESPPADPAVFERAKQRLAEREAAAKPTPEAK